MEVSITDVSKKQCIKQICAYIIYVLPQACPQGWFT